MPLELAYFIILNTLIQKRHLLNMIIYKKAKRILLLTFMVLFTLNSQAQESVRRQAAISFIHHSFNKSLQLSTLAGNEKALLNATNDTIAFILNLRPQGYIIIAPSTSFTPIIAFSTENNFNFNPSSTNIFLQFITQDMTHRLVLCRQAVLLSDSSCIKENSLKWNKLLLQANFSKNYDTQYGPLLASLWGGVNCLDFYSQPVNVGNYYTPHHYSPGCVATATSIVMHYYKWPKQGLSYHTDVDNQGSSRGSYYANFGATKYEWWRMLDKYYRKNSYDKNRKAMGLLAYHCAVAVDMNFEYNGSSSNLNRTPNALNKYFRYSAYYKSSSWINFWPRLRANIRNHEPVMVAISKTNGEGHAMVCDGYGSNSGQARYYHLQFGWWGSYNGWYSIQSNWDASGYSIIDGATFDILPDPDIAAPLRTENQFDFTVPILVSDSLRWQAFKIWESYNGGSYVLKNSNLLQKNFHRIVSKSGNYRYKAQAKVNGKFYANSISVPNEVNVARKDSAMVYLHFDGSDSFFVKDNSMDDLDIKNDYTIETWVKIDRLNPNSAYDVIMDRRTVFSLYLIKDYNADYAFRFVCRNASDAITASLRSDSSQQNLSFGDWVHLAISRTADTTSLFVNGKQVDQSLDSLFKLRYSIKALNIGARYWGTYSRYMIGDLDEIRISKVGRYKAGKDFSPYHCMPFVNDSSTLLLMHLDENSGKAVGDFSRHFFNTNLRSSPNSPNWIKKNQTIEVEYKDSFKATTKDKSIELSWSTEKEINKPRFEIYKSMDKKVWYCIDTLVGKQNSTSETFYTYLDKQLPPATYYYRLKQVQNLCKYQFTAMDSAKVEADKKLMLFPIPASGNITIQGFNRLKISSIKLYDINGKLLNIHWLNDNIFDVSNLSGGIYFLLIKPEKDKVIIKKFIVK